MRHRTKKVKFKNGTDANRMLMRKLMYNFLRYSHIKTTEAKGKALKSLLDTLISKSKEKTEANKNYMLKYFNDKETINALFDQVGPSVAKISGGFVKLTRLNERINDSTMMVELNWAHPVIINWKEQKPVKKENKIKEQKEEKTPEKKVSEVTK